MHPRNRYNDKPDFGALADFHPPLKPYLIAKSKTLQKGIPPGDSPPKRQFPYTLDFSQPEALRELTYAVLRRDFNLDVLLPLDKLIPAIPQRLNYIHWVEDLLGLCDGVEKECVGVEEESVGVDKKHAGGGGDDASTTECVGGLSGKTTGSRFVSGEGVEAGCGGRKNVEVGCVGGKDMDTGHGGHVIGIDIGTGASCIYPLLGTRLNNWEFLATDIDKESITIARENVSRNGLANKITVKEVAPDTVLEGVLDLSVSQYTFSMCNPPFFRDSEERLGGVAPRSGRRPPAETFSSASAGESVTEGGEVELVKRIIDDSLSLRQKVKWYTSMLGKKASLKPLLSKLQQHDVPVVTTTEFVQGRTWRWGLGWSFDSTLKDKVDAYNKSHQRKKERPFRVQLSLQKIFPSPQNETQLSAAREWLLKQLNELEINVTEEGMGPEMRLVCTADKNTWSHQRKRRRLKEHLEKQRRESIEAQEIKPEEDSSSARSEAPLHTNIEELERKIMAELQSLSTPCSIHFSCSLECASNEGSSPKKRKVDLKQPSKPKGPILSPGGEDDGLCVQFEWIEGKNKDSLHQIVQYLQNKLQ